MRCVSCSVEIQASFKHAIVKNECPCCGKSIMDEETLALIENVEKTILEEAAVREETAKKLAMTIVAKYEISIKSVEQLSKFSPAYESKEEIKIANSSTYKEITNQDPISIATKMISNGEISDVDREKFLEEAVQKKYNMVSQAMIEDAPEENYEDFPPQVQPGNNELNRAIAEASINPILEQERLARLSKQQQAFKGGGGSFRRGS